MKRRHQRIVLTKIAHQIYTAHVAVFFSEFFDFRPGAVRRPVIDQDKLARVAFVFFKFCHYELYDLADRFFRIIAGDYN